MKYDKVIWKWHICPECNNTVRDEWGIHYHKMGCSSNVYLYNDKDEWKEWTMGIAFGEDDEERKAWM